MKISAANGKILVKLAKQAISSAFSESDLEIPAELQTLLSDNRGVFVTLTKKGQLRGCIGMPEPILPLGVALIRSARSAAFSDPRFPKLSEDELKKIKIEITVLTEPKEIKVKDQRALVKKIKVGRDGLLIDNGDQSGILLPQVALEWKWNAEQFLENTCQKAGLDKDAWLNPKTKVLSFQGQIFKE
jgi:uncharacterized protein